MDVEIIANNNDKRINGKMKMTLNSDCHTWVVGQPHRVMTMPTPTNWHSVNMSQIVCLLLSLACHTNKHCGPSGHIDTERK